MQDESICKIFLGREKKGLVDSVENIKLLMRQMELRLTMMRVFCHTKKARFSSSVRNGEQHHKLK